jgi:vacuolar protein sorting-associated protein 13A/C
MVFENLVVYLLDKYLGDYIENLDTKKLKIDLWSGKIHHQIILLFIVIILR